MVFSIFQIIVDILFLCILYFLIVKKENSTTDENEIPDTSNVEYALQELVREARTAAERLTNALEEKRNRLEGTLQDAKDTEERIKELIKSAGEPERPGKQKKSVGSEKSKAEKSIKESASDSEDQYAVAARLIEEGLSVDEIAKKVDLPKSEIELILDLKK